MSNGRMMNPREMFLKM